jgi:undecaprenyl-diphosphatase
LITDIQAAILGVAQGLTEFLPISSSAHLVVIPWALNWPEHENMMAFDVALHIGTLLAIIIFFFFDWAMIVASYIGDLRMKNWKGSKTGSLFPKIVIATIPAAIMGKIFEEPIEAFFYDNRDNIWMLAITMSLFGMALLVAERYGKQKRDVKDITYQDALIIGCFQAMALIPGTSRSGITILGGLLLGLARPAAARFSFLAALPVTFGAVVLKSSDLKGTTDWSPLIIGIAVSAVVGLIAIKGLLTYVQHRSYDVFAWYRFLFAIGLLVLFFTRT